MVVNQKIPLELSACDTLRIARALLPGAQSKKLESLCEYFQIEREHAHRALDDAVETYKVFENLKSIEGASMELFVPKPLVYKAKRQTPATEHQKRTAQGTDGTIWKERQYQLGDSYTQ